MLSLFFHGWERRLADVSKDRVVRPFEWGLDWLPPPVNGHHADAAERVRDYIAGVLADPAAWYHDRDLWSADLFHVSAAGHRRWADVTWDTIQPLLAERDGSG